jgi:hypothetical protein
MYLKLLTFRVPHAYTSIYRTTKACFTYNPQADAKIANLLTKKSLNDMQLNQLYELRKQSSQAYLQTLEDIAKNPYDKKGNPQDEA